MRAPTQRYICLLQITSSSLHLPAHCQTYRYNKMEERAEVLETELIASNKKQMSETQSAAKLRKEMLVQKVQMSLGR